MLALTREQVRRVDRLAIEQLGIPGVVLMENAGRAVAEETLKLLSSPVAPPGPAASPFPCGRGQGEGLSACAVLLCGGGNNGGDGYVAARHLHNAGVRVLVCNAAEPSRRGGDAAVHRAIVEKMGLPCRDILDAAQLAAAEPEFAQAAVFIDALLGTGFHGAVHPHLAAIIRRCNALTLASPSVRSAGFQPASVSLQDRRVVAVDVPSGLDCDTGRASDPTIRADLTVTFVALKKGFLEPEAGPYLGRVVVASIGVPPELATSDH